MHPGGKEHISLAAGGAVEPFWNIFAVHKGNPHVYNWLEQYRIGNLNEQDYQASILTKNSFILSQICRS
jgi:sulfite oxidase